MTRTDGLEDLPEYGPSAPTIDELAEAAGVAPHLQDGSPPVQPVLWRVLIEPIPAQEQTEGGIILPEQVQDAEGALTCVGRVAAMGSLAFRAETKAGMRLADEVNRPKLGWYVVFNQYAGQKIWSRDGREFRIVNDTEILAVTETPDELRNYV